MDILLGVLALGVALISLWISSTAQKGFDNQRQQLLTGIRAAVGAHENSIASLDRRVQAIDKAIKGFQDTRVQDARVLAHLEEQTRSLRSRLVEAPESARTRSAG